MIDIVAYDPSWPIAFAAEAASLRRVLSRLARSIEHVGSTSVPGLAAKPVIDIQVSVESLHAVQQYGEALAPLGYARVPLGDFDRIYPYFEKPSSWPHTHHVHLCEVGSVQERVHLAFRDYLRAFPEVRERYMELKRRLAGENDGGTLALRERYSLSKTEFVDAVVAKALAEGYPLGASPSGV